MYKIENILDHWGHLDPPMEREGRMRVGWVGGFLSVLHCRSRCTQRKDVKIFEFPGIPFWMMNLTGYFSFLLSWADIATDAPLGSVTKLNHEKYQFMISCGGGGAHSAPRYRIKFTSIDRMATRCEMLDPPPRTCRNSLKVSNCLNFLSDNISLLLWSMQIKS